MTKGQLVDMNGILATVREIRIDDSGAGQCRLHPLLDEDSFDSEWILASRVNIYPSITKMGEMGPAIINAVGWLSEHGRNAMNWDKTVEEFHRILFVYMNYSQPARIGLTGHHKEKDSGAIEFTLYPRKGNNFSSVILRYNTIETTMTAYTSGHS